MANNRLYLVARDENGDRHEFLLAKGWASGWQVWEPEEIAEKLAVFLNEFDCAGALEFSGIIAEDESRQAQVRDIEVQQLEEIARKNA